MDVRDNPNRKVVRIPLVGVENSRYGTTSTMDQRYLGWTFDKITNPLTNKQTLYCEKTPIAVTAFSATTNTTWNGVALLNITSYSAAAMAASFFENTGKTAEVTVLYNNTIYSSTPTGVPLYLTEAVFPNYAGTLTTIVLVGCDDNTYWFVPMDALTNLTFTGDTHTNTTIDNISSTAGLWVGQEISGTGITAGTRIASINSSTSITTTVATTATNSGITITRTRMAKIIDSDFPSDAVGPMRNVNGYAFVMTSSGYIYNSDLNSLTSWSSTGKIAVQMYPDKGTGLFVYKNQLVAFSRESIEFFEDVGNPTGSPLKSIPNASLKVGALFARYICSLGDSIYFLGKTAGVGAGLYELKDYKVRHINSRKLDAYATVNVNTGNINSWNALSFGTNTPTLVPIQLRQKYVVLITVSGTEGLCYIYDPELDVVTEPVDTSSTSLAYIVGACQGTQPSSTSSKVSYGGSFVLTNAIKGSISSISATYTTGNTIYTSPLDFGVNNLKRIHKFRLIGDQDTTTNTMTISWSDDDGANFSTARTVSMSSTNPTLVNLGNAFRRRIFKIVSSTARAVRLEAIELEYSELDH